MVKTTKFNVIPVEDEDHLWRKIHPIYYIYDQNLKKKRFTSSAFKDKELSVYIAKLVIESKRNVTDLLKDKYANNGMVSFTAGFARSKGQEVIHKPHDDNQDVDPAHGLVKGRKSHKTCLEFAENCVWLVYPKD